MRKILFAATLVGGLLISGLAYGAYFYGTKGDDRVSVERSGSVAYLRIGNDTFVGARGRKSGGDHVYAGGGDDHVKSFGHTDILRGWGGDDYLDGGAGRDGLYGWVGADTLVGGPGQDLFRPGPGFDTCIAEHEDRRLPRCEQVKFTD